MGDLLSLSLSPLTPSSRRVNFLIPCIRGSVHNPNLVLRQFIVSVVVVISRLCYFLFPPPSWPSVALFALPPSPSLSLLATV